MFGGGQSYSVKVVLGCLINSTSIANYWGGHGPPFQRLWVVFTFFVDISFLHLLMNGHDSLN